MTTDGNHQNDINQSEALDLAREYPAVTFQGLTFSDDTTVQLDPTDVVIFVGPNNAGKSVALRELEERLRDQPIETIVVKSAARHDTGTSKGFRAFLDKYVRIRAQGANRVFSGYGINLTMGGNEKLAWPTPHFRSFCPLFCMRIPTENRITASNPAEAVDPSEGVFSHPVHMLYDDDQLEEKISGYFSRAFGEDLILDRTSGRQLPLRVGQRLKPDAGEDRISKTYRDRLRASTVLLQSQGDGMRSFASVILHLLAPITPSILLLDEPEAFLHPPQARLLGEIIATEKSTRAQLFVATHSPDVLHGLINVAPDHLRVLRIQRDGNINRIKELDKELVKKISSDPLMKYSSVMSGVFHERVIICESDADCMFYSSLLDLPDINGGRQPDVLFIHASGKDRMATLAEALVALDVPVDIFADIDVLNNLLVLKGIIEALDGNWADIESKAAAVKKAIEEQKPWLSVDEIKRSITDALDKEPPDGGSVKQLNSEIRSIFRKASPWDAVKEAGKAALPQGQATQQFLDLQCLCKKAGLWIVPVGEMEGFCKSIGGHGPGWVRRVIEQRDLATDAELDHARKFVHEMWKSR